MERKQKNSSSSKRNTFNRGAKKKGPQFDRSSVTEEQIDYKNFSILRNFLGSRHQIIPRKYTKLNARLQRKLSNEIKKSRQMGLLKYTDRH